MTDALAATTTDYDYDELDRLTRALTTAGGVTTDERLYDYDAVGNRSSETLNGVTTTAGFNAADQLTSRGGVSYSYDANGNQTASSAGQALSYNSADQTTSLKKAGGSPLSATYAGPNQVERITAGATAFTNTELGVTSTTEAGATVGTTRDPNGSLVGLRSGAGRSYYLVDGLGSVAAMTDSSGAVTHSYSYDPYGVTSETTSSALVNPWRYTGQYQDLSTGLYKMGARYYQPDLGRWTQRDPSGLDANAYAYVGGNPVNFVDPSGFAPCLLFGFRNSEGGCVGGSVDDNGQNFTRFGEAVACGLAAVGGVAGVVGSGGALAVPIGLALSGCLTTIGFGEAAIEIDRRNRG